MPRPPFFFLAAVLLFAAPSLAQSVRAPLDPSRLAGADVFAEAESIAARAAQAAGIPFAPDPRPLPPRVVVLFDASGQSSPTNDAAAFWRGDMLPDQLAPAESGTLFFRSRALPNGLWQTDSAAASPPFPSPDLLVPSPRGPLPSLFLETAYRIGSAGDSAAELVLWRSPENASAPIAGAVVFLAPAAALSDSLLSSAPAFESQSFWRSEFDALSP